MAPWLSPLKCEFTSICSSAVTFTSNTASRYPDLLNYRDGIYHHVASSDEVSANPWEATNHEVVVVGWGVDDATQENYWIVKNSWGRHFGLTGYFYVRRSTDEIAIESMAVSAGDCLQTLDLCCQTCDVMLSQNPSFSTWLTQAQTPATLDRTQTPSHPPANTVDAFFSALCHSRVFVIPQHLKYN